MMQASKEQSPRKENSCNNNSNNNKSETVAQLVMNINNGNNSLAFAQASSNSQQHETNSAISFESDKEVEEITSRASRVDLNKITSNGSDQNNNAEQQQQQQANGGGGSQSKIGNGMLTLTMPNLISSEPISSATRQSQHILTPSKMNNNLMDKCRQRHQSSSKESVAKSDVEIPVASTTTTTTTTTITLDTKIPHPSAASTTTAANTSSNIEAGLTCLTPNNNNNNNKDTTTTTTASLLFPTGGKSSCSNSIEEVSYYNQDHNMPSIDMKQSCSLLLNPANSATNSCSASTSSSCNNNNNNNNNNNISISTSGQLQLPISVVGGGGGGAASSSAGSGGATAKSATRTKPMPAKEQKLSIIVPQQSSSGHSFGSFSINMANGGNNKQATTTNTAAVDPFSREYCNDFDDYDTAAMEDLIGGSGAAAADDEQRNSQESPSSPKAKSAPATPCNVTPTAFHQHNPANNKSNLPNPANTLPVDTRRNISATCRMLPSSISLAHNNSALLHHQAAAAGHTFSPATLTAAAAAATSGTGTINNDNNNNNSNNGQQQQQLAAAVSDQDLDKMIVKGESLFRHENYDGAIRSFSQCIELASRSNHFDYLKKNFRVYSQRAEGYFKLGKYNQAIEDSMAARELNPKWAQAHYILGNAQFQLGKHVDSLTAFSFGLAQVPTNKLLFEALVSAALQSSYPKLDFEENYNKLRERDLDKDPFVVVSALGQELLAKHHHQHAAIVLESALKLGTENKRFKSSVLSTTSYVFCAIGDFKKALAYMKRELEIETELNDVGGQCRVLSNIGYNYYKMGKFDKSLETHREQLRLAIRNELHQLAAQAFNAIGHIHVAQNEFANALTSHQWCLDMLRRLGENEFDQYKELLAIGHVNALLADYKTSEERYKEAMQMLKSSSGLKKEERQVGLIMVYFNLAYLALKRQSFIDATQHYEQVMNIAREMDANNSKRLLYELRALNGLGHTCRVFQRFHEARIYFTRQLELAKKVNDLQSQSQALCNLGMTYQHFKDYNTAWKLFDENMQLVEEDPLLKAYAYSYRGSMHFLWGEYTKAHEEYERSLNIFKELDHCSAERKTIELNLDAVSERLGRSQISLASNTARVQRKVIMA